MGKKNKGGMVRRNPFASILATLLFAVLGFLVIFPGLAGALASFRPGVELLRRGLSINLNFSTMNLDNWKLLFTKNASSQKYFMWFKNSMVLTLVTVVLTLIICYFVAYGLSMYEYRLKNLLFFLVIATMMVPFEILGLMNTAAGVILPGLCGASTIFFFRQYMIGLPKELLDAARIDGATEYGICLKIMLPITKPAFASMAILSTMGAWNNMLWPMMVFRDADKFTLPIGLNTLLTPYGNDYDLLIAGSMFGIIPIFVVFLCFQRYFIEGMTVGAVKG